MALVIYFLYDMVAATGLRALRFLSGLHLEERQACRARFRAFAAAAAVAVVVLAVPLPNAAVARGVVWLPDQAVVRAETEGFVEQALVRDGLTVQAGELMFVLSDPSLAVDKARLEGQVVKLQTERIKRLANEPARAQRLRSKMAAQQAALDRVLKRTDQLQLHAASSGTLSVARAQDWPGRQMKQGTVLADVIPSSAGMNSVPQSTAPMTVRVALEPEQAALLRSQSREVLVRLPHMDAMPAQLLRDPTMDATATVTQLPGAALGDRYGGDIVAAPTDLTGRTAARGVVLMDLLVAHAPAALA